MEADKETVPGPGSSLWSQEGNAEKDASFSLPTNSQISKTRRRSQASKCLQNRVHLASGNKHSN